MYVFFLLLPSLSLFLYLHSLVPFWSYFLHFRYIQWPLSNQYFSWSVVIIFALFPECFCLPFKLSVLLYYLTKFLSLSSFFVCVKLLPAWLEIICTLFKISKRSSLNFNLPRCMYYRDYQRSLSAPPSHLPTLSWPPAFHYPNTLSVF
jgi:hypothetical protein